MNATELRAEILRTLRDGELNLYELADTIDQAPFRVRGELKAMKRDRLVREHVGQHHTWELTGSGTRAAWAGEQQEMAR